MAHLVSLGIARPQGIIPVSYSCATILA